MTDEWLSCKFTRQPAHFVTYDQYQNKIGRHDPSSIADSCRPICYLILYPIFENHFNTCHNIYIIKIIFYLLLIQHVHLHHF